MTAERRIMLTIVTDDTGTKCAAECPQFVRGPHAKHWCRRFGGDVPGAERHADCIAAEQAAREAEVDALQRIKDEVLTERYETTDGIRYVVTLAAQKVGAEIERIRRGVA